MTIEAIVSFTGFLFVIFTILGVVNICRAQMLISNAVDTAAKELTQYSYFYEMSGLSKFKGAVDGQAEIGANNLNDVIGTVDTFASTVGNAYDKSAQHKTNIENAVTDFDVDGLQKEILSVGTDIELIDGSIQSMEASFSSVAANPLVYMKSIVAVAGSEFIDTSVSHVIAAPLSKALFTKHFGKNATEANKELEKLGVVGGLDGMNFKMSTLFAKESPKDIHIVVYYKLKLVQALDWATLEVPMCKESIGHAWLGGDSVVKKVKPMEKPVVEETPESEASEGEEPEKETSEEETPKEEDKTEDGGGSTELWALPQNSEDGYYMVRTPAFYDLMGDTYGFEPDKNSAFLLGHNGPTAYACTNIVNTDWLVLGMGESEHSIIVENAYLKAAQSLKDAEAHYDASVGDSMGQYFTYKPGEVKEMTYVIYVPENIPDDILNDMKSKYLTGESQYKAQAKEVLGRELDVTISFVKAGGNYDYGSDK